MAADTAAAQRPRATLVLLIAAQVLLHAEMAGQRMAAPLQMLHAGRSAGAVGVLLALFAALPVLTALGAGRLADRHGWHRPLRVAVGGTLLGALCAFTACWLPGGWQFALLCVGSAASGVGANSGMIAVLRNAGRLGAGGSERLSIFAWVGMAPSLANVVGPVLAGQVIDRAGYASAYAVLGALSLLSLAVGSRAQVERPPRPTASGARPKAWTLLRLPGFRRLLFVNWLLSASWDVNSFAVPVLGHERGYSAGTIGLLLGTFTTAVTLVRFAIPLLAHRLDPLHVLRGAMLLTALSFALYPLAPSATLMGGCAALLGLTLGAVQPMVMNTLHLLTPEQRHGEAIAFRSMAINLSSSVMPLAFGLAGAALGAGVLFWLMGAAVAAASWAVPGLRRSVEAPAPPGARRA